MHDTIQIGSRLIGKDQPAFIIAEIGLNHNGDIELAKELIDAAVAAKCDAVKFQKRTPDICVPEDQKGIMRVTPWGTMTYLEYRYRVEFETKEYQEIDKYCKERDIMWLASCWDKVSVDFLLQFKPPCLKISSANMTDDELLLHHKQCKIPIILSTGMSTIEQIDHAVEILGTNNLIIMHCTSTYPAKLGELNLRAIPVLMERYGVPVGYSGHEVGLATSVAAAVLGACMIERHITLDRAMWGSDQAASVEPHGFTRLVRDIRAIEQALGDGEKRVYESEIPIIKKLRRV